MKRQSLVCAILALSLSTAGYSFAQGNSQHNERGRTDNAQHGVKNGQRDKQDRKQDKQDRKQDKQAQRGQGNDYERRDERGAGPNHSFYRGQRLPTPYRSYQYVVDDWRGHHLSAPPRGYHWVQNGSDYLLVAITTGLILELLLDH